MGLFSSVLKIGGSIIGGIYGGPAGAAAGGAIGGAIGGAVGGDNDSSSSSSDIMGTVASSAGQLAGGIMTKSATDKANINNANAIQAEIAGATETNQTNILLARENRDFQSKEAQANRNWQQEMSSTAHQREVADLKAAGLNPILSATGGSGASTGSGGQASGSLAQTTNPYSGHAGNVNDARKVQEIMTRQLDQELKRIDNENKLADSTVKLNEETTARQNAEKYKAIAETGQANSLTNLNQEKIQTERDSQNYLKSGVAERASNINLNSALAGKQIVDAAIQRQHYQANEKMGGIKLWTGNVKDIADSIGEGFRAYKLPTGHRP